LLINKTAPFVSIVVPVRDEGEYVEKCINSLIDQDYPAHLYEILVVDGISKDHSIEIVQSLSNKYHNIFLLENPHRLTSFGLNIGIRESKGEIIIILGAHSFVPCDFIRKNAEFIKKADGSYCVGGPIKTLGDTHIAKTISLAMSSPFGVGDAIFRYTEREAYADTVAFGAYKKEVFNKIGLFDEELVRNQDDEFNYRLRKAGGNIFITPQIKSFYFSRANFKKLFIQYFRYGFWKTRVFQKHPGMMRLRQFVPGIFVLALMFSAVFAFYYPVWLLLFTSIIISYIVFSLYFSFSIARKEGWKHFSILPVVFAILHFSYGLGFLAGCVRFSFLLFQKEKEPPRL